MRHLADCLTVLGNMLAQIFIVVMIVIYWLNTLCCPPPADFFLGGRRGFKTWVIDADCLFTGESIKKMMLRKFETEARKALGALPDKTSIPKVGFMYMQSCSNPTVLYWWLP